MTRRWAQMQTLLCNFKSKVPYILLDSIHFCGEIKLQLNLNTFRDVLDTISDSLQRIVERHRSVSLLGPR